jgi:glycosyltransferase involved in cell wall biosynthesis
MIQDHKLPRISIVTPSYNQGPFVEWTVRSVFLQNYPELEYIFMDGGSTDDTLVHLKPYRHQFAHFYSAPDGGQSDAIARGFELSTGDIMAYLNSDDVLLPGALNFVAHYFQKNPHVDFIYSHRCIIDESNRVTGHWILPKHFSFLMRRWDYVPQETCFWRRRLFEKGGNIDSTYDFAMDYDLFVRYMNITRFRRVNRFLAAFRVHPSSKTSSLVTTKGREEVLQIQKKYAIHFPPSFLKKGFDKLLYWTVRARSIDYVTRNGSYPGLPPGKEFNLDDLFGGLLNQTDQRKNTHASIR